MCFHARSTVAVERHDEEADKRQYERNVHRRQSEQRTLVDNAALQGRHERAAHNCHDEECGSERSVLRIDVFEGDAVNGGEHERHENADSHEAVESAHADDENRAQRGERRSDAEAGKQHVRIDVLHQEGADEAAAQEHRHGDDVVVLGGGFVDAEIVGVLYDERPDHDLRGDVEHLRQYAFAVDFVFPEAGEGLAHLTGRAVFPTGGLRHFLQRDDDEHYQYDDADSHVGVANDGEVVQPDFGFLGFGKGVEENLSGGVASVRPKSRQHDERGDRHARERAHGIERLRHVEPAGRTLFRAEREYEGVGGRFEERQSECQNIQREAEKGKLLIGSGGNKQKRSDGIEGKPEQDTAFITVPANEKRGRHCHGGVAAVECELHHGGFCGREFHDGLESGDHGVGDVVGESPQGKQRRDEDKGNQIFFFDEFRFGGFACRFHKADYLS